LLLIPERFGPSPKGNLQCSYFLLEERLGNPNWEFFEGGSFNNRERGLLEIFLGGIFAKGEAEKGISYLILALEVFELLDGRFRYILRNTGISSCSPSLKKGGTEE